MEQGAEKIAQSLAVNTTLTTLSLGVRLYYLLNWNKLSSSFQKINSIGDKGAERIAEVFKVNNTVTSLDLWVSCVAISNQRLLWCLPLNHNQNFTLFNTAKWNWSWRSREDCRSIEDQQHIDLIESRGEYCCPAWDFFNNQLLLIL